ncbi:hypothetical protein ABTP81_20460, partial [Acinetobacter baumannii]
IKKKADTKAIRIQHTSRRLDRFANVSTALLEIISDSTGQHLKYVATPRAWMIRSTSRSSRVNANSDIR